MTGSRAMVLVVEDAVLVRQAACEALVDAGYIVVATETADQAMGVLAARGDIDLVFIDVDLPGACYGADLVRLLLRQAPWVSVVVTSGVTIPAEVGHGFLSKPYEPRRLVEVIARAIATAADRSPDVD